MPDRRALLVHHLRHNHVPAWPLGYVAATEQAIDLVAGGAPAAQVELPGGISLPAHACVQLLHLEGFCPPCDA